MTGTSNWQFSTAPMSSNQPVISGGGGQIIQFRDPLDARRAMMGQVPTAEYPDGYLGNVQSRREDRLLDSLKNRLNQRNYQRGVHKGEQTDPADYLWPAEFGLMTGIDRQATTGLRAAPLMTASEQIAQGTLPRGAASLAVNPYVQPDLARLAPSWK